MKTLAREDCRAEIIRRLRTVQPGSTPRWGRMSAHQMVCHLADACRMALGQKAAAPIRGSLPPRIIKWIALYLPLPWPRGIPTVPELDQQAGGTAPVDFTADLAAVEALLNSLPTQETWAPHPIFGPMSRRDWLRWGYAHTAHHLSQFSA